jgi:DNA polymerase-3 subunit epsilon
MTVDDLDSMVRALEETGQYRVLRRLDLARRLELNDGTPVRRGIFLDIESTGLDPSSSEPIELAMVPFDYTNDGRVFAVHTALHQFNEPSEPIPPEITAITGLTDEQVIGHKLDTATIDAFASQAAVILAHNAAFDRPFAERISPLFAAKPWACTMCDVPWRDEGIEGRRLSDLLSCFSYFFDPHRAVDDCQAGIALTTMVLPKSGKRVLEKLLHVARQPTWRIFAEGAPFETKDVLKHRGYRWNTNPSVGPRAWRIDVDPDHVEAEVAFLKTEILRSNATPPIYEITAFQRYSNRSR